MTQTGHPSSDFYAICRCSLRHEFSGWLIDDFTGEQPIRFVNYVKLVVYALTLVSGISIPAIAEESTPLSELASEIDQVVSPYVAAGDFMGVIAVQRVHETPLIRSYGLASVELAVPHEAKGIFLIGSISKQFTAAAILLLEEEGKLNTSDLVRLHIPEFKPQASITIEQLLTHTSGVADVFSLKRYRETGGQGGSFPDVVRDLSGMKLTHEPGSAYAYSNGGYAVLAAVIEQISGTSYREFLQDRIFKPLGMSSTTHDVSQPAVASRVPGYDPWGIDRLVPVVLPSVSYTTGSGSLWSCASDLLTWNRALHGGQFLARESYSKLTHDYGYAYGYGVSIFTRFARDVIGHDGRITGYASDAARYIQDQTTVVILSNVQSVARDEIRRSVAAIVFGEVIDPRKYREFSDWPSDESITEMAGVYTFGPGFNVTISYENNRLLARANEGSESELVPLADGTWFSRALYAEVSFVRDESGHVSRLKWGLGDNAPIGIRQD